VVEAFNPEADLEWAFMSVCGDDYRPALEGIGRVIRAALDARCPVEPLVGCADPGAREGWPADDETCNDTCRPDCTLTETVGPDGPNQTSLTIPPCLEVCPTGPCPNNRDPALAYANARPALRDPNLPVDACFHVAYNPLCELSFGAEVRISRQTDAPDDANLEMICAVLPRTETCCDDGIDNDEDCKADHFDPDCTDVGPPL
jgi:hypothetical protein